MAEVTLYQFPISHYCEKVRWALDYKGIEYRAVNLLPGLHVKPIKKLAKRSSVPVVQHGDNIVQGASAILDYLESTFPEPSLAPEARFMQDAQQWERYADQELGVDVRRYCYHTLLDHPKLSIPLLCSGNRWWTPYFLRAIYPKLNKIMRKTMQIDEPRTAQSLQQIEAALVKINQQLEGRQFLAGDQFTRADLSVAAMLAPLFMPEKYGVVWPKTMPEPVLSMVLRNAELLAWAKSIYADYR